MFNKKKKLIERVQMLENIVAELMKQLQEQEEKINPPIFGGRKQG